MNYLEFHISNKLDENINTFIRQKLLQNILMLKIIINTLISNIDGLVKII